MNCPNCNSHNVVKYGNSITKTSKKQKYKCNDCGRYFVEPKETYTKTEKRALSLLLSFLELSFSDVKNNISLKQYFFETMF